MAISFRERPRPHVRLKEDRIVVELTAQVGSALSADWVRPDTHREIYRAIVACVKYG
jgi:hypothetical protein